MLFKSIGLKNFKCFEEVDIEFAPITLLTGANSSGKSSLINAILGIIQSRYFPQYLSLNGKYVNMGGFEEVLHKKTHNKQIDINVSFLGELYRTKWIEDSINEQPLLLEFDNTFSNIRRENNNKIIFTDYWEKGDDFPGISDRVDVDILKETDSYLIVRYKEPTRIDEIIDKYEFDIFFKELNEFGWFGFNYIGSYRLPPERTYYRKPNSNIVGVNGEGYIDQIIDWEENNQKKFKELSDSLRKIGLFYEIKSNKLKGGRFEINVKVAKNSPLSSLTDVGFGISQFLPIIVADLQLDEESLLITSQPEIHLHPKIQASLANYFCNQIHRTKKQYIIETHSEYMLNRIRLLLVKGELKPNDVRLYYMENDGNKTTTYHIELTTDGQIKGAPRGFFETYEMDVMDIALAATEI